MGIDMTGFKMIYKDQIYNCLAMFHCSECCDDNKPKIVYLEVTFINLENRVELVRDDVSMFQFISK